jgi:hypothetical protein
VKGRHDELPLLSMLRSSHSRKSKTHAALRRIFWSAQKKTGRTESYRITEHLPVKLWTNGQYNNVNRFPECDWPENHKRPSPIIEAAHRRDRIPQQIKIFARGGHSHDLPIVHHGR